ncbi:MAG: amidase [Gammaproteobacteria bacterium]
MKIKRPTLDDIELIASQFGLELSVDDLASFQGLMEGPIASYERLEELVEPKPAVKYPRTAGYRPEPAENPLGAWYYKCSITGARSGRLKGRTVAVKDNVCVAGVPMMNGASVLEGYVPDIDATVVTRLLDAGAEIVGKTVYENLCFSGGSHTNDTGPVRNPHSPEHSTGGSSAGSAALVANGEVDMAIGGDQGGSIRMPASWCGIVGLKPTHGLVPYTGAFPIEITLDHLGPMTRTVEDCALMLEVIAGPDGMDPRQRDHKAERYSKALSGDVAGLRIGVVTEGFGWEGASEADSDELVRGAAQTFKALLGAEVEEIAIPLHRDGIHIWNGIAVEGATALMIKGNGMGTNWEGYYTTSLLDAFARGRLTRPNDLSETTKLVMLMGQYMEDNYHGRYYAKAQNLAWKLRNAYDAALEQYDLLLMPTMPMKATKIPAKDCSREEYVARALEMIINTAPFDVSGHPAITVPCAKSNGLPVGMMLIGRHYDETTVLRAAHAFEQTGQYTS